MNALMKKGLRPLNEIRYSPRRDGMNALMKKGLRPAPIADILAVTAME